VSGREDEIATIQTDLTIGASRIWDEDDHTD
jgi:hypothetical protein